MPKVGNASLPPLHTPFMRNTSSSPVAGFHHPPTSLSSVLHRCQKRILEQHLSRGTDLVLPEKKSWHMLPLGEIREGKELPQWKQTLSSRFYTKKADSNIVFCIRDPQDIPLLDNDISDLLLNIIFPLHTFPWPCKEELPTSFSITSYCKSSPQSATVTEITWLSEYLNTQAEFPFAE